MHHKILVTLQNYLPTMNIKLRREDVKDFFNEIGLATDKERALFLNFLPLKESEENSKEQIFIRLESKTSSRGEYQDAKLA